ncbi:MAG: hypothetical protein HDS20_06445 [Bacteroides sp.]|nr:hypothetical protein [Bacteroides sp.]
MKRYISIPITGRELHQVKAQGVENKAKLTPHGHECITSPPLPEGEIVKLALHRGEGATRPGHVAALGFDGAADRNPPFHRVFKDEG